MAHKICLIRFGLLNKIYGADFEVFEGLSIYNVGQVYSLFLIIQFDKYSKISQ